jgi:SAM-dependent methyltransferase
MDELLRATARAEARHFWFRGFRWFVTPLIRRAVGGRPGVRLLDCGCGTGANLDLLARYGEAYGFDRSAVGLQFARRAGRRRIARGSVAAVPFPGEAFDLVTSFDVLYSLSEADEHAAVAEMFRLAKPGGFALVNVAAMPVLRGDHSVLSRELRRYSRAGLRDLLTRAGFEVVRLTHTNQALFLPMLAVRTWHRQRGLSSEGDARREIAVHFAPINAILSAVLFVESLWLRYFDAPVGSSLICLARKPRTAAARIRTPAGRDAADRAFAGSAGPAHKTDPSRS